MNQLATLATSKAPALISAVGDRAAYRFLEFFTAQIRNPHTRRAYVRAVGAFCVPTVLLFRFLSHRETRFVGGAVTHNASAHL